MKNLLKLFSKKKDPSPERIYDAEIEKPIIRASICTGERTAGFKNLRTGAFREVMLIRDRKDLDSFMKTCGIEHIDTEY